MKFQSKTKIGIFIGAVVILLVIGVLFFCIAKPSTSDEIRLRHTRPGRSAGRFRPHRHYEQRHHPADRHAAGGL